MKKIISFLCLFFISITSHSFIFDNTDKWFVIKFESDLYTTDGLFNDLYFPKHEKTGKVKFVEDDKNYKLGYVADFKVDSLDVNKIPKKYLVSREININGQKIIADSTSSVTYDVTLEFLLLDKDGFEIVKVKTPQMWVQSGSNGKPNNFVLQGKVGSFTKDQVKKVVSVKTQMTFVKCITCK